MIPKKYSSFFILLLGVVTLLSAPLLNADRLYLKDGSYEDSDRIWESEDYIHFILKGTRTVEIRYAKEIVARIERDGESYPIRAKENETTPISPQVPLAKSHKASPSGDASSLKVQPSKAPLQAQHPVINIDNKIAQRNRNVAFYDPRRDKRYWSDRNSGHMTLSEAVESIAQFYGKTPKWVEQHMGQENDLGMIHSNLIASIKSEHIPTSKSDAMILPKAVPAVIDITDSNTAAEDGVKLKVATLPHTVKTFASIPRDILFYDPRRTEKYWASLTSHHNTLQEAIHALSEFYGIPATWVEAHLGNTNQLFKIHENIRTSLIVVEP